MDVSQAKTYYNELKKEKGNEVITQLIAKKMSAKTTKSNFRNRKYALFKKAYVSETNKSSFVEVPLVYNQRNSLVLSTEKNLSAAKKAEIFNYSFDRLLIYKSKKTGKVQSRIVSYIPDLAYLKQHGHRISHNQLNKLDKDFTGYLEFKKWDGKRLYLLRYENGKKVQFASLQPRKIKQNAKTNSQGKISSNATTMSLVCDIYEEEVWGMSCIDAGPDDSMGSPDCEPYFIGIEYVNYCFEDGYEPDPCLDYGDCGDDDPVDDCLLYGYCDDGEGPETGSVDCAGVKNGSAYMTTCGCIGGTTGVPSCPTDPCDRKYFILQQAINPTIAAHNTLILSSTTTYNIEYGTERNLKSLNQNEYFNTTVRTGSSSSFNPNFTWNSIMGFTVGVAHGHPGGSAPSPADAIWAYGNLNDSQLLAGGTNDVNFYKDNVSVMAATTNGNYVITVKDWAALGTLYNAYHSNPSVANADFVTKGQQYLISNPTATSEAASAYALISIYGNAINVFKADSGSNLYTPLKIDSFGKVTKNPCE